MANNRFMKSSNPFIGEQAFVKNANKGMELGIDRNEGAMTIQGTINKSLLLAVILVASALGTAAAIATGALPVSTGLIWGTAIGGLVLALISFFKPTVAYITAPLYAVVEGAFVGTFSFVIAASVGNFGIIFNAILLTALCLVVMLVCYKTGLIKVTAKLRSIIVTATGAIFMVYMVSLGLHMFGINIPYLHEGGVIGIGISLFIIGIAAFNLLLDFDNIERGAQMQAPKFMEWVSALGLLVTIVWIYLEILRLLSILNRD